MSPFSLYSSGGLAFLNTFFSTVHRAIHILFRQDIRRQRPQHLIVRAVDQQALLHRVEHDLLARELEFHSDHQAVPAHFLDE